MPKRRFEEVGALQLRLERRTTANDGFWNSSGLTPVLH
jgi:hypothetical protein